MPEELSVKPYYIVSPDNEGLRLMFLAVNAFEAMLKMLYYLNIKKKCSGEIKKSKHGVIMLTDASDYFCKEYNTETKNTSV